MAAQFPNCQVAIVTASAQVGLTGARIIRKVTIGGATANTTAIFKNAATNTGDALLTLSCLANDGRDYDYTSVGGIAFGTAVYCLLAGAGAIVHVWYD
jgi:hypothetical protein